MCVRKEGREPEGTPLVGEEENAAVPPLQVDRSLNVAGPPGLRSIVELGRFKCGGV